MAMSDISKMLQEPGAREQAMRHIAVGVLPIPGGGDEQSIDAATPSVDPPFSVGGVLLPDDTLAVLLTSCDLEALVAMKRACKRLLTLARRTFRNADWIQAHATDAQHAMWTDMSYVENVIKIPGLAVKTMAVSDVWLAVGTADSVRIYSLPDTSNPTRTLSIGSVHALEIQEDKLLCEVDDEFQIWDLREGERQFTITPRSVETAAWSSGVLFVAEAEEDGNDDDDDGDDDEEAAAAESVSQLVLWNTATGLQIAEGTLQLGARDYDAERRVMLTGCSDLLAVACTARLACWRVQPGNAAPHEVWRAEWSTASLPEDETFGWELAFSDGRIVAAHWPTTASVWSTSGALLMKFNIERAGGLLLHGDVLIVPPAIFSSNVRSFDMRTGREFENRISLPAWDHAGIGGRLAFNGSRLAIASSPFFAGPNNNLWMNAAVGSKGTADASEAPPPQVLLLSLYHLADPT